MQDCEFADGYPPPEAVSDNFVSLSKTVFAKDPTACIAIHCVAGLGRAPIMVALALIENGGLSPEDAVLAIRDKRRGAINTKLVVYLI